MYPFFRKATSGSRPLKVTLHSVLCERLFPLAERILCSRVSV